MSDSNQLSQQAFIAAAAKRLLDDRKMRLERESKLAAKQAQVKLEQEMPLQELKESAATVAASYRPSAEAAHVLKLTQLELASVNDRRLLLDILASERVKQRYRMKQQGLRAPRKAHRNRIALADRVLRNKFGPLTPLFQFHYDAEVDSPMLSQHNGKYRCKCDCGRIVYKHKHHLLRTVDEPGRAIRTCGKECGLSDRTAKPVDAQSAHRDDSNTTSAESPNAIKAAFAQLHERISDIPESAGSAHIKGTSARGKE